MRKDKVYMLINKLNKYNITNVSELLMKDEVVLDRLLILREDLFRVGVKIALAPYKNNANIIKALDILEDTNKGNESDVYSVLVNKKAIKAGISLEGAKILKNVYDIDKSWAMVKVLTSEVAINGGVAIKGAKLLKNFSNPECTSYGEKILTDQEIVNKGYSLQVVKEIMRIQEVHKVMYITEAARSKNVNEKGIVFDAISIIKQSKKMFNSNYIYLMLENKTNIDVNTLLECAKIINESKKEINAKYIYKFIMNSKVNKDILIEGSKQLNDISDTEIIKNVYETLTNKELNEGNIALDCAKKIALCKDIRKYKYIKYILLTNKEIARSEYVLGYIWEICSANREFSEFINTSYNKDIKLIEFGLMILCHNNKIKDMNIFERLFKYMRKLDVGYIYLIKNCYQNIIFRKRFNSILNNKVNFDKEIVKLIKEYTNIDVSEKNKEVLNVPKDDKITKQVEVRDTDILLGMLNSETNNEIDTKMLCKRLVRKK